MMLLVHYIGRDVPAPRFFPDWEAEGIEVVVADQFFTIVDGDPDEVRRIADRYPYITVAGEPADGCWVAESGSEVYISEGSLLEHEWQLWEALGLRPADFGGQTWHDLNEEAVRARVPTF